MGICELNPESNWTVSCISAAVDATKQNGSEWDGPGSPGPGGALPDVLCRLMRNNNEVGETSTVNDQQNPTWNQPVGQVTARMAMSQNNDYTIFLGDDDGPTTTIDTICQLPFIVPATGFEAAAVTLTNTICTAKIGLTCASLTPNGGGSN
jgi:hypothetical protein